MRRSILTGSALFVGGFVVFALCVDLTSVALDLHLPFVHADADTPAAVATDLPPGPQAPRMTIDPYIVSPHPQTPRVGSAVPNAATADVAAPVRHAAPVSRVPLASVPARPAPAPAKAPIVHAQVPSVGVRPASSVASPATPRGIRTPPTVRRAVAVSARAAVPCPVKHTAPRPKRTPFALALHRPASGLLVSASAPPTLGGADRLDPRVAAHPRLLVDGH